MAHANVGLLLEDGRMIKASKTAIINVDSSNDKMSFLSVAIDSIVPRKTIKAECNSVFFCDVTEERSLPFAMALPLVAKLKVKNNMVICAIKQTEIGTYVWGVELDELLAWSPPAKPSDLIKEDGIYVLHKLPHSDIESFAPVENTSTQPQREG